MSRRNTRALPAILLAILLCALPLASSHMRAAERRLNNVQSSHQAAMDESGRVNALRAKATRITEAAPPEPDLVARLHAALRASGLETRQLASVSTSRPEPARRSNGAESVYRRVTAPIVIESVRPSQLARFTAHLAANEPAWTLTGLTLSHESSQRSAGVPNPAGSDLYTARLTLENIHIQAATTRTPGIPR